MVPYSTRRSTAELLHAQLFGIRGRLASVPPRDAPPRNFTFDFINNYFTLFYIAFLVHIEIKPGVQAGCQPAPTCMNALQMQLMIIFTARQLFFPRPISPSFSLLARACLWYSGARFVHYLTN